MFQNLPQQILQRAEKPIFYVVLCPNINLSLPPRNERLYQVPL